MTLQEEQQREMAILQQINFYEMSIHQKEMDIALDKKQITVLEWQLKELRHEFQSNPELTREEIAL